MPNDYFQSMVQELKEIKAIIIAYTQVSMNEAEKEKFKELLKASGFSINPTE